MKDNLNNLDMGWNFDNSYVSLPKSFYSSVNPTPVSSPKLIILNNSLVTSLGLNEQSLQSDDGVSILSGNLTPESSLPIAQAYGGHQFGYFTMLGDGRAILLGEQITPDNKRYDIQLKGCGKTPYSRGGDGRATLGPMLREYIISEAMYGLGIPTTRSLAVVTTGETVMRESPLPGAILTRVADSHIRVGTFQYAIQFGFIEDVRALADYTIQRHFSYIINDENKYLSLLKEVIKRQASLIAKWQLVGFIHGVMNTDNMVISGETIDYGPCAFMDTYNPATVFSSIDVNGRYAYGNQPAIAAWNLARFSETLLPLIDQNQEKAIELAQKEISNFNNLYNSFWLDGMRKKLGLFNNEQEDKFLIKYLLSIMNEHKADYTNTFIALTFDKKDKMEIFNTKEFKDWNEKWQSRLKRQQESSECSLELMKNNNPAIIPRNHRVEEALEAAVKNNDYSVMMNLLCALKNPYEHSKKQEEYSSLPEPTSTPYQTFCGT